MAHKKGVGSSRNGRDSNPKYRGIKKYGGEFVMAGNIILRQCGTKWHPGTNVGHGHRLHHLLARRWRRAVRSTRTRRRYKVSVLPVEYVEETVEA